MSDVAHPNCAAHGCPCLGVMTRSTTGTTEWYCAIHFGAQAARWQAITAELRRLDWLVQITRNLRGAGWKEIPSVMDAAHRAIALNTSNHLRCGADGHKMESLGQWLNRLEQALADACRQIGETEPLFGQPEGDQ